MANKELSAVAAGTTPTGTELLLVSQGANSRKLTFRDVVNLGLEIKTVAGTTYTAIASDRGKWIRFTNAGAVTFTIDNTVHTAADEITYEQAGAGVVTLTAGAGVTLNARGALLDTNGQFAVCTVKAISASTFTVVGDRA